MSEDIYKQVRRLGPPPCPAQVQGAGRERLAGVLLRRHPEFKPFVAGLGCALISVAVETYQVVTRFQSVAEFRP